MKAAEEVVVVVMAEVAMEETVEVAMEETVEVAMEEIAGVVDMVVVDMEVGSNPVCLFPHINTFKGGGGGYGGGGY